MLIKTSGLPKKLVFVNILRDFVDQGLC